MERNELWEWIRRFAVVATIMLFVRWIYGIHFRYQVVGACVWFALVIFDMAVIHADTVDSTFILFSMADAMLLSGIALVYLAIGIVAGVLVSIWFWCQGAWVNPLTVIRYWVHTHHWVAWLLVGLISLPLMNGAPTHYPEYDKCVPLFVVSGLGALGVAIFMWWRERRWMFHRNEPLPSIPRASSSERRRSRTGRMSRRYVRSPPSL